MIDRNKDQFLQKKLGKEYQSNHHKNLQDEEEDRFFLFLFFFLKVLAIQEE